MREYEKNSKGHEWIKTESGNIDIFAYETGHCNGPKCSHCGYEFCHHCQSIPSRECTKETKCQK